MQGSDPKSVCMTAEDIPFILLDSKDASDARLIAVVSMEIQAAQGESVNGESVYRSLDHSVLCWISLQESRCKKAACAPWLRCLAGAGAVCRATAHCRPNMKTRMAMLLHLEEQRCDQVPLHACS